MIILASQRSRCKLKFTCALLALGILLGTIVAFAAFSPARKLSFLPNGVVFPTLTPTPRGSEPEKIQFKEIDKGSNSKQNTRKNYVINSNEEWQETVGTPPEKLEVPIDFSKETVLAVFQGTKSTGGYAIEVSEVQEKDGILEILVIETSPGLSCLRIQVITSPYHIVRIPKFVGEVEFKVKENVTNCLRLNQVP